MAEKDRGGEIIFYLTLGAGMGFGLWMESFGAGMFMCCLLIITVAVVCEATKVDL